MSKLVTQPVLKIDAPTGQPVPGRGFYQLEEDVLYAPVGQPSAADRFFSYLESDHVRFDIAKSGRLLAIEVTTPRHRWEFDKGLTEPTIAEPADIRWLDFRTRLAEPKLLANASRNLLRIEYYHSNSWRWFALAENVLIQTNPEHQLTAVLISNIEDDLGGQRVAAFRKRLAPDQPRPDAIDS